MSRGPIGLVAFPVPERTPRLHLFHGDHSWRVGGVSGLLYSAESLLLCAFLILDSGYPSMAVASSPAATAVATTASKTKAKQRYLKRKKERKKHRKTITPKPSNGLQAADDGIIADEDDWESDKADEAPVDQDEEEASDDMAVDEEATPENANEKGQNLRKKDKITTKTTETTSAVPRKRRKLDDELTSHTLEPPLVPPAARTPTPPPLPLPSFPAPVRPDAPSKLDLALQGIDQGLVEAEIIDPASVQSIATDGGDDNGTGISDRTRKRLAELGITELFAGTSVSPLLRSQ